MLIEEYKLYVRAETRSAATIRVRDHYIDRLAQTIDPTTAPHRRSKRGCDPRTGRPPR